MKKKELAYTDIPNRREKIKIVIMVIVSLNAEKWQQQYFIWNKIQRKIHDKYSNVNVIFLQCNKEGIFCNESYSPGIFQKTVQGLKMIQNKYDMYIRTNLSTFFNLPKLIEMLNSMDISKDKSLYGGTYIFPWGVSGSGIFLNNPSVNKLLKKGTLTENYLSLKPDDVVIGDIMKSEKIEIDTRFPYMHQWDNKIHFEANLDIIKQLPYVRMKDVSIANFQQLVDRLL